MKNKITHGRVCRKVTAEATKTPVPTKDGADTLESTVTLNFWVGSVCSEEIFSIPVVKELIISLQNIVENHK